MTLQTSPDTTTGIDGTWTTRVGPSGSTIAGLSIFAAGGGSVPSYRTNIATISTVTGIKGVRAACNGCNGAILLLPFHIYGNDSSGQNPDSLRGWHPTLNQALTGAELDMGDIARGTGTTKQFRIKNNSSTKTAHVPVVSFEVPTNDPSPSLNGQIKVSTDNINFFNSITIPDLTPGAISAILYCQEVVLAGAQVGLSGPSRLVAAAASLY